MSTDADRRSKIIGETPKWYNPWVHLLVPSLGGATIIAACLALRKDPRPAHLLAVPAAFLFLNLFEWFIHRRLLHDRWGPMAFLNERHIEHHTVFHEDDMAIRHPDELRFVLMPAFAIIAAFFASLPIPLAMAWFGLHDPACYFAATTMTYLVSYELLHASYHAPEGSFLARTRFISILRRHHTRHHNPYLMRWLNFNVTVPLGDLLLRTLAPQKFTPTIPKKDQ
jgi:hypothetical protein